MNVAQDRGGYRLQRVDFRGQPTIVLGVGDGGLEAAGIAMAPVGSKAGKNLIEVYRAGMFDIAQTVFSTVDDAVGPGDGDAIGTDRRPSKAWMMRMTARTLVGWQEQAREMAIERQALDQARVQANPQHLPPIRRPDVAMAMAM